MNWQSLIWAHSKHDGPGSSCQREHIRGNYRVFNGRGIPTEAELIVPHLWFPQSHSAVVHNLRIFFLQTLEVNHHNCYWIDSESGRVADGSKGHLSVAVWSVISWDLTSREQHMADTSCILGVPQGEHRLTIFSPSEGGLTVASPLRGGEAPDLPPVTSWFKSSN